MIEECQPTKKKFLFLTYKKPTHDWGYITPSHRKCVICQREDIVVESDSDFGGKVWERSI